MKALRITTSATKMPDFDTTRKVAAIDVVRRLVRLKPPDELWMLITEYAVTNNEPIDTLKLQRLYKKLIRLFKGTDMEPTAENAFWARNTVFHIFQHFHDLLDKAIADIQRLPDTIHANAKHLYLVVQTKPGMYRRGMILSAATPFTNLETLFIHADTWCNGKGVIGMTDAERRAMVKNALDLSIKKTAFVVTASVEQGKHGVKTAKRFLADLKDGEVEKTGEDETVEDILQKMKGAGAEIVFAVSTVKKQ